MGTEKRQRQKANRQVKLQEITKQVEKQKKKRLALRVGLGIVAAFALIFGISKLSGNDTTTVETSATIAADTTTTVVSSATVAEGTLPETTVPATVVPLPTVTVAPPEAQASGTLPCPQADGSSGRIVSFPSVTPPTCIDRTKTYMAEVETTSGSYTIELDATKAPATVNNFVYLARYHYFDNTLCHRIVPSFMIQCGDPTGTGSGGPGYEFDNELPQAGEYKVGSVAMANAGADTNGSQFFVVTGDAGVALPPNYSLFGQVTDGLDSTIETIDGLGVADNTPSKEPVFITGVTITEK